MLGPRGTSRTLSKREDKIANTQLAGHFRPTVRIGSGPAARSRRGPDGRGPAGRGVVPRAAGTRRRPGLSCPCACHHLSPLERVLPDGRGPAGLGVVPRAAGTLRRPGLSCPCACQRRAAHPTGVLLRPVTECARAHTHCFSKQVQKTCQFWQLMCWL